MTRIHITLQGKGGVGKSFVSSIVAQHQIDKGHGVACIDTDPVNSTLPGYADLDVRRLDLMAGTQLDERRFDEMMQMLLGEDRHFVIDNGAASFIALSNYLVENQAVDLLCDSWREVFVHAVITGGQALLDTLAGFSALAKQLPPAAALIVWMNPYFGDIVCDGKSFEETKAYLEHRRRVHGLVRIPRHTSATFGKDVELMLDRKLTFRQAVNGSDVFSLMAKQRLAMVRRELFEQLDLVLG